MRVTPTGGGCAAAKPALRQRVAPGDDVGARHDAKFLRQHNAGEAHETTWRGPRTAAAGLVGMIWPMTIQSNR